MKWKDIVRGPLTQSCEGFKSVSLSTHYNGNIEYLLLTFILQTKVLFFAKVLIFWRLRVWTLNLQNMSMSFKASVSFFQKFGNQPPNFLHLVGAFL